MFPKATLTQSEVLPTYKDGSKNPNYPHDHMCKSGHKARSGSRFFALSGPAIKGNEGIYCIDCLVAATAMSELKKPDLTSQQRLKLRRDLDKATSNIAGADHVN